MASLPARRRHGKSKSQLYRVWKGMRERCSNPNHKGYRNYGGRGITVCSEWQDDFEAFERWALTAGYCPGLTIDRTDNSGGYTPGNCRFVTSQENCNNTRRNRILEAFGERKSLSDWSRDARCVVDYGTLKQRVRDYGWQIEESLTVPSVPPQEGDKIRGSQVHTARLTEADIPAIRVRIAAGEKHGRIAEDYGVARVTINHLACGRSWKHVK